VPAAGAVTSTVIVQEPPAGIEPPVMLTVEGPEESHGHILTGSLNATVCILGCLVRGCLLTPVSGGMQVELTGPATKTPLGNVSVKAAVRLAVGPELLNVIVSVERPPALMAAGLNALPIVILEGVETVKVAMAGAVLLPLSVCNVPAGSVLK